MSRIIHYIGIMSLLFIAMMAIMAVADKSYERIDIICQEGC